MSPLLHPGTNFRILWIQFLGIASAVGKRTKLSAANAERIICGQADPAKIFLKRGVDSQFVQADAAMFRVALDREIGRLLGTHEGNRLCAYLEFMNASLWHDVAAKLGIKVAAVKLFLKGETCSELVLDALNAALEARRKPAVETDAKHAAVEIAGAGHGLYQRVASTLGVHRSHVRRVALGLRKSDRVSAALIAEASRVEQQILERRSSR
jgi:hypothetical protein